MNASISPPYTFKPLPEKMDHKGSLKKPLKSSVIEKSLLPSTPERPAIMIISLVLVDGYIKTFSFFGCGSALLFCQ
jgi:hypothetical protein